MKDAAESIDLHNVTLAILAGGAGSRMGGPKTSLVIRGKPILEYLLERFRWPGPTMLVLAPGINTPPGLQRFSSVVCDPVGGEGPLRGILTALEHTTTPITIVTSIDMPALAREHLDWLAGQPFVQGVMSTHRGQVEPFPLLIRGSARDLIVEQLAHDRRSVHGLLKQPGLVAVESPSDWPEKVWTNLNTPKDLEHFLAMS